MQLNNILEIDQNVWCIWKHSWNEISYELEQYRIRSISISCNSKKEWKISYRVQHFVDDKVTSYGFNFSPDEIGDINFNNTNTAIFLSREEAEKYFDILNRGNK